MDKRGRMTGLWIWLCGCCDHRGYLEAIYEQCGDVLYNGYDIGTVYHKDFPMRNRLIAALSDKLFVIDVGRNSGTISTIESGDRYGREIEVVA